jgi:hypothetical protein
MLNRIIYVVDFSGYKNAISLGTISLCLLKSAPKRREHQPLKGRTIN